MQLCWANTTQSLVQVPKPLVGPHYKGFCTGLMFCKILVCLFVITETTGRRSGPPLQFCSSQLAGEFHSVVFRRVGECTRLQEAAVGERRRAVRGDVLAAIAEASVTELSEQF